MAILSIPRPHARTGSSIPRLLVTSGLKIPDPPISNHPSTGCLMWISIEGSVIGSTESVKKYYPVNAGDLQFTTLVMALGETKKGHSQSFSTTAYNTSNDTIVLKFDNNTSHITTIAVGDTIAPGKISTISFFFDSDKTPVWGINDDHITIIATPLHSGKAPWRIDANIIANVIEDFSKLTDKQRANSPVCSVNVQKLLIADMGRGESSSETVLVENTGKSNLIIRRAMSTDKAVVAKTDKTLVKPGEKSQISVGIYSKNVQGDLINSQLTIISNDPYNPRITIPIVGRIIQK